jgi:hypothetical protein
MVDALLFVSLATVAVLTLTEQFGALLPAGAAFGSAWWIARHLERDQGDVSRDAGRADS